MLSENIEVTNKFFTALENFKRNGANLNSRMILAQAISYAIGSLGAMAFKNSGTDYSEYLLIKFGIRNPEVLGILVLVGSLVANGAVNSYFFSRSLSSYLDKILFLSPNLFTKEEKQALHFLKQNSINIPKEIFGIFSAAASTVPYVALAPGWWRIPVFVCYTAMNLEAMKSGVFPFFLDYLPSVFTTTDKKNLEKEVSNTKQAKTELRKITQELQLLRTLLSATLSRGLEQIENDDNWKNHDLITNYNHQSGNDLFLALIDEGTKTLSAHQNIIDDQSKLNKYASATAMHPDIKKHIESSDDGDQIKSYLIKDNIAPQTKKFTFGLRTTEIFFALLTTITCYGYWFIITGLVDSWLYPSKQCSVPPSNSSSDNFLCLLPNFAWYEYILASLMFYAFAALSCVVGKETGEPIADAARTPTRFKNTLASLFYIEDGKPTITTAFAVPYYLLTLGIAYFSTATVNATNAETLRNFGVGEPWISVSNYISTIFTFTFNFFPFPIIFISLVWLATTLRATCSSDASQKNLLALQMFVDKTNTLIENGISDENFLELVSGLVDKIREQENEALITEEQCYDRLFGMPFTTYAEDRRQIQDNSEKALMFPKAKTESGRFVISESINTWASFWENMESCHQNASEELRSEHVVSREHTDDASLEYGFNNSSSNSQ